jgi:hypothetical protein
MRLAFLLQAGVLVLTVLVGVYLSIALINYGLVKNTLRKEAAISGRCMRHPRRNRRPIPTPSAVTCCRRAFAAEPAGQPARADAGLPRTEGRRPAGAGRPARRGRLYLVSCARALTLWLWFGIVPVLLACAGGVCAISSPTVLPSGWCRR